MRSIPLKTRRAASPPPGELIALGLVSALSVVLIAQTMSFDRGFVDTSERSTVFGVICALVLVLGALGLQAARTYRLSRGQIKAENASLRRRVASAEGILRAEPQVLIYWEPGEPLRIINSSLAGVPGLPENDQDLLRFGKWLEPAAASDLKAGLDALFEHGRAFNMIVRTRAGGHLEAEGRTAGGRALLRLRDVIGYKRDLARIIDQHTRMRDDIEACRALLDNVPSPIWFRGADGRLSWVNRAYCLAVEAASATEVSERQIELLEMRQRQAVDRLAKRGDIYRERAELLLGGELKPHELVVVPLDHHQAALALDVGAVEQAQGELDRRSAAYERTLDKVATAVAIFSADRKLSYFNEAFLKLWGLDPVFLKTRPTETVVLDKLREAGRLPETTNYRDWRGRFLSAMRGAPSAEELWHLPDGRTLQVMAETRDDGGVTYLYADQTQKLELESRFNQQLTTQRETLDALSEGVAVFGSDGKLRFSNAAFAKVWLLSAEFLASKPHLSDLVNRVGVLYADLDTWDTIKGVVGGFAEHRQLLEGSMVRTDGSVISYSALPLPDGATLLTFADVTSSKEYERLLEERNQSLEATAALKSRFISHVSYELRTPLTTIIGFNDMLSSPLVGSLNPKQREYLADITSSSKALLALVDNILDLATIDAGAMELRSDVVSVARVIDDAIEGVRDRAIQAKLTIDIGLAQDATTFLADEARVRQVLYNLISNAVGFSRQGDSILISAWREAGAMKFAVEDKGVGIPEDQIERMFERFETLPQGSGHRGAGLGLSIVKSLVDLHKGSVEVKSRPGEGTRVVASFPDSKTASGSAPGTAASLPQVFIPRLKAQ